jgi:predicted MFS family arabinose efflux permease
MKKSYHLTLLLVSLGWLIIFVGRLTPSTLLVQIMKDLQITDVQAGIALSGM